ncbi:hypothetical protein [Formosa haliotis]|uniref:hypothetical protein n=1 Tax=Formosa haliotis TaxID=1555194 RepID=UPI000824E3D3|nr:hypothetical protein [Formosa haliotis]
MRHLITTYCILLSILFWSCKQDQSGATKTVAKEKTAVAVNSNQEKEVPISDEFKAYWYSGKAEINSYALKQSRYGEIRDGEVVLIFVTEPFSLSKQVKLDRPKAAGSDKISVLKLNNIRKFNTGIYDYSIVTSTFTPIQTQKYPNTLKVNTSVQEWCGHTFTQLNLGETQYKFQQFSYFESEGDTEKNISIALLEDELMSRIRISNGQLPLGDTDIILSTLYSRFAHKDLDVAKANISKTETDSTMQYTIAYQNYNRTVSIQVEKHFPYKILSWIEDDGNGLITEAHLIMSINEPYWNQKKRTDEKLREELQLVK